MGVPIDLAASNGLIWVLDPFAGTVTVVDADDARVLQTIEVHGRALAATEDAVWVADDIADVVHRIDPRTRGVVATIELPEGSGPSDIAAADGAVWVVNALSGTVSRIEASTNDIVVPGLALARVPTAIAAGSDAVWVISAIGDTVMRIDPDTNRAVGQERSCDDPTDIAVVGADAVVACAGERTVVRFTATGDIAVVTPITGAPSGIGAGDDMVWVSVRES